MRRVRVNRSQKWMAAVSDLLLLNTRTVVVISLCFVPSSNSPQSLGFLLLNLKRQTANRGTPSVPLRHTHTHTQHTQHTHTHTHAQVEDAVNGSQRTKWCAQTALWLWEWRTAARRRLIMSESKSRTTGRIRILPVECVGRTARSGSITGVGKRASWPAVGPPWVSLPGN